jgi:hypothetical protein
MFIYLVRGENVKSKPGRKNSEPFENLIYLVILKPCVNDFSWANPTRQIHPQIKDKTWKSQKFGHLKG